MPLPKVIYIMEFMLLLLCLTSGIPFFYSDSQSHPRRVDKNEEEGQCVLIGGDTGRMLSNEMKQAECRNIVSVYCDDNKEKQGTL